MQKEEGELRLLASGVSRFPILVHEMPRAERITHCRMDNDTGPVIGSSIPGTLRASAGGHRSDDGPKHSVKALSRLGSSQGRHTRSMASKKSSAFIGRLRHGWGLLIYLDESAENEITVRPIQCLRSSYWRQLATVSLSPISW